MAEDWSQVEVTAIVADYVAMLERELRREPFNKREHNRRLQTLLSGRTAGSIEFKHQNISAIMIELGFPYIDGYKPRANNACAVRIAAQTGHPFRLNPATHSG
jgi:hypothetical protein